MTSWDTKPWEVLRRALFLYLFLGMLGLQAAFIAELAGFALPVGPGFWVVLVLWPVGALLLLLGQRQILRLPASPWWWLPAGLLVFGLWAGGYFLIGNVVDPSRVRVLPEPLARYLRLVPAFTLLYMCVHPLSVLPYFVVDSRPGFRRLLSGQLVIVVISFICWSVFPVALPRPPPPVADGLGSWALGVVYAADPDVNCLPSTHAAMALFAALVLREQRKALGRWALITAAGIGVATLYTRQHYLFDVVTGFALAALAWTLVHRFSPAADEEEPRAMLPAGDTRQRG